MSINELKSKRTLNRLDQINRVRSLENFDLLSSDAILRHNEAADVIGISKSTYYRLAKDGKIKIIQLSPRRSGIKVGNIREYLNSMKQGANPSPFLNKTGKMHIEGLADPLEAAYAPKSEAMSADDEKLWCVHILGPDDVMPKRSRQEALNEANELNVHLAKKPRQDVDPIIVAVAVEWPYSADAHAKALATLAAKAAQS